MRHVVVAVAFAVLFAACDPMHPTSPSSRAPTPSPASFQVSNSGVAILELAVPGSHWATGINADGQIIGIMLGREFTAFLWTDGVVTTIDASEAQAINQRGQVACNSPPACVWENGVIRVLPTLGGGSVALDINDAGEVVGTSRTAAGENHAVIWSEDAITDLGVLIAPAAINNAGRVAGTCGPHACVWDGGNITDLGTLGGDRSAAADINDAGQVVGVSRTATGEQHGFVWAHGTMTDLGDFGTRIAYVTAINNGGQIVGYGCLRLCDNGQGHDDVYHAFLLSNGTLTDLGTLGGTFSQPFDINGAGQVVGRSTPPGETNISELEMTSRSVLWEPNRDNTSPQVTAGPDEQAEAGQPVSVTFGFSDATPNGPWTWSVGWGHLDPDQEYDEYITTGTAATTADPISATHTYPEGSSGPFHVRVRVMDSEGGVGFDDVIITVGPAAQPPPTVTTGY